MDRIETPFQRLSPTPLVQPTWFDLKSPARLVTINAGLALVYILAAWFGLHFASNNPSVTILWPASGIAVAAVLLLGRRALVGVAAGAFIANLLNGMAPLPALFIALGNSLEALTAVVLLERLGFRPTFERMRDAFLFISAGAGVSALMSATIGTLVLVAIGSIDGAQFPTLWLNGWLGNALGILMVAPLILTWATTPGSPVTRQKLLELTLVACLMIGLTLTTILVQQDISLTQPLGYLAYPGLVWISLRFDRREVITTSFVISLLSVVTISLVGERSPDYMQTLLNGIGYYLATLSATALLLSAALTERRLEAAQAERARRHFASVFELNPSAITITTLDDGRYVDVNQSFLKIVGYSREELLGKSSMRDVPIWHSAADRREMVNQLRRDGQVRDFATQFRAKSGELRDVLISLDEIELEGGRYLLGMVRDETEPNRLAATLRESEARFRTIFEHVPVGISFDDYHGKPILSNPAYTVILGYSPDELKALPWQAFTHPEDIAADEAQFVRLNAGEIDHYQMEKRYFRKSGEMIWGRLTLLRVRDSAADIPRVLSLLEDITERKQAEEAIRQSEARFRAIVESAPIGISFYSSKHGAIVINQAICDFLGYNRDELIHMHWQQTAHPEDLLIENALLKRLEAGEITHYQMEKRFIHQSGEARWGRLTITRVHKPGTDNDDTLRLALIEDIREQKAAAEAMHQINATLEERVQARTVELEAANARLTELDRMKSRFIADVSHELRTPLSVLNTRVYLLERSGEDKSAEYLQGLREQIERLSTFVNSVLDLSRIEGERYQMMMEEIALNPVAWQSVESLLLRAQAAGLALSFTPVAESPVLMGNADRLGQVVTNLVSNALKYTRAGQVQVSTGLEADGERAWLRVQDTGIGIPAADLPHIFDRFYRAQNVSQLTIAGTGLGLSITKEIVEMHGGEIAIDSTEGVGTTVTVWLPVVA
jgi:PAS domain S-box-containing protein